MKRYLITSMHFILIVFLGLLLGGCKTNLFNAPLAPLESAHFDPDLVGNWQVVSEGEKPSFITISKAGHNWYKLVLPENSGPKFIICYFVKMDSLLLWHWVLTDDDKGGEMGKKEDFPMLEYSPYFYSILLTEKKDGGWKFKQLDPDSVMEDLQSNLLHGSYPPPCEYLPGPGPERTLPQINKPSPQLSKSLKCPDDMTDYKAIKTTSGNLQNYFKQVGKSRFTKKFIELKRVKAADSTPSSR